MSWNISVPDLPLNKVLIGEDVVEECGNAAVLPSLGLFVPLHFPFRSVSWWRDLNDNC